MGVKIPLGLTEKNCNHCNTVKVLSDFHTDGIVAASACIECTKIIRKLARRTDARRALIYKAKERAKRDNLPFNITIDDITIPNFCPVLGIKIAVSDTTTGSGSPSIDKVIPALGYVKGNVQVISHRANRLKADATVEELKAVINYIEEMTY